MCLIGIFELGVFDPLRSLLCIGAADLLRGRARRTVGYDTFFDGIWEGAVFSDTLVFVLLRGDVGVDLGVCG